MEIMDTKIEAVYRILPVQVEFLRPPRLLADQRTWFHYITNCDKNLSQSFEWHIDALMQCNLRSIRPFNTA